MPQIGFYGDDFTGSVDALLQFRRAGLTGTLVTSTEALRAFDQLRTGNTPGGLAGLDVVGIAGIARSLPSDAMVDEVGPPLKELRRLGVAIVQYKACSTADSSPTIGSLGRVIEIGREIFGAVPVPVAFAQPDFGRYTVFGHHFARDGDRVYRLDRQPTMRHHPVTPMTDSDLRLHLGRQTQLSIGSIPWTAYDDAADLQAMINTSPDAAVVCDALTNDQLTLLGRALLRDTRQPRFVLGSGGLSLGLGRALTADPTSETTAVAPPPATAIVLNGSTSPRTREQIDHALHNGWVEVDAFAADIDDITAGLHTGAAPTIITSHRQSAPPDPEALATRLATIADACLRVDPHIRVVVSGGDTSGQVVTRLGIRTLTITHQPWDNVALCSAVGEASHLHQVEMALKGGQMGHPSLFDDIRRGRSLPTTDH